jgi:hypothetical protein
MRNEGGKMAEPVRMTLEENLLSWLKALKAKVPGAEARVAGLEEALAELMFREEYGMSNAD